MTDKREERGLSTVKEDVEEETEGLQKRVPKKADWLLEEDSRRKKSYRSSVLGQLTHKANAVRALMEQNELLGAQVALEEWQHAYFDLEESHGQYQATLDADQINEDTENWAKPHFEELDQFRDEVQEWIKTQREAQDVKPSDSISQAGSGISSVASSARLSAKLRRAELTAKAAALEERAKLQEREFKIKKEEMELARQREMLEVKMELAQEDAKLQALDEFEGIESPAVPRTRNVKPEIVEPRRTPNDSRNLNPEARDFHPTLHDRNGQKSPTPEEFLQGLVSQQAEVTKLMIDHNNQASLPTRTIRAFDGNPLQYTRFTRAFKHAIESKTTDAEERLGYLEQYTTDEARRLVSSCTLMAPEEGYTRAKEYLRSRYGTSYKISQAYAREVSKWQEIKPEDKDALREFALFLQECGNAMEGKDHLQELNHYSNLKLLVTKLPFKLRERWRRRSHEIIKERPVSFSDFATFVQKEEDVVSNEVFGDLNNREKSQGSSSKQKYGPRRGSSLAVARAADNAEAESPGDCLYCAKTNHCLSDCRVLGAKPMDERLRYIKGQGLCFGCLKATSHLARDCRQRAECKRCQRSHPTVLHRDAETVPKKTAAVGRVLRTKCSWEGVPPIIPVKVRSRTTNITVETYAFLDSGSDVVFCTESLKDQLKTSGRKTKLTLNTINDTKAVQSEVLDDLEVMNLTGENVIPIATAYTQERIPASKDNIISTEDLKAWPHLKDVDVPKIDANIGLLIGNTVPKAVEPWQVINSIDGGPYAIRTVLGWSVNGPLRGASDDKNVNRITLEQQLTEYFNKYFSETREDKKEMSVEDKKFMNIVSKGTNKNNGHYQVPLPFKNGRPKLPNNKQVALQRAQHLRRKMMRNESFQQEYTRFMEKIIDKGYAEKVPTEQLQAEDGQVWYVPHHGVYHPQKGKIRVVFDCAASYAGTSLNKELLQGPDLTNTLLGVLTRFRQEPVALMADIEAMFSQVKVPSEDRDYQRFMWWPEGDINEPLEDYRMTVHVFGATSSPSCANYALKRIAEDCKGKYNEEVLKALKEDFYVDDLLKAMPTEKQGQCFANEMREACATGGFRLTKWVSNSREVLKTVPTAEMSEEVKDLDLGLDKMPVERTLGMLWNVQTDMLGFRNVDKDKPATKRGILSTVSSMYDPLGLIAPATLHPKLILQDLCREKKTWDERIPEKHVKSWQKWEAELPLLSRRFEVDRCVKPVGFGDPTSVQLHHIADASESGYGTASYIRMENQDGRVHCALLMGKARVAPLKKVTILRLELNAAVVAVRVDSMLKRELDLKVDRTHFWTDSTTVLRYINNETTRFHTFVANRLAAIRTASNPKQWHYVESSLNPADDASRAQSIEDFIDNSRWVNGPQFLWGPKSEWPQLPEGLQEPPQMDPEVKVNAIQTEEPMQSKNPMDALIAHYSSWYRLKKAVAWIAKVKQSLKQKSKSPGKTTCQRLSTGDLARAELEIVRHVQRSHYSEEIVSLQRSKGSVKSCSSIFQLNPKLDEEGILRVGGRLRQATLSEEMKHPMMLPKTSRVSELVIQEIHEDNGHLGRNYVTSKVRERYWIPQVNSLIRQVNGKCVTCRRHHGKTGEQKMADLPSFRVIPENPLFTNVGVDYFGPFEVKRGRSIVKRYGVIFTCTTTRAVHLEKADSLDTDSCINALRRFIARRGQVRMIISDNGTNLVGAKSELKREVQKWNNSKIHENMLKEGVDWTFNPPSGSHFGGIWERQIRTVRQVLYAISKNHHLDDEGLSTLFCEVEYIINSRPITPVNMEANDLEALTPNHLLMLKSKTDLPPNLTEKGDQYARRRWKQIQYIADLFWKRWVKEYLPTLQGRQKWGKQRRNFAVGDLVLLKDENNPRGQWPMGRVVEVASGSEGLVRHVKVKTQHSTLERPIDKLCPILEEEQENV
ncbi:uncharacterized protein [Branchiostoma lanceolatum]|uniref:uncharacterized protein n=1 Tax=Branchiostoma lanceolatum TaxID=7740 RepID=UPI003456C7A0